MKQDGTECKKRQDWKNIPNLLSIVRILLIPVYIVLFLKGEDYLYGALIVLVLSGATDLLDGWIARRFHMITDLGKLLDPMADKLTQAAVGICMMIAYYQHPTVVILFAFFFLKELLMTIGGVVLHIRKVKVLPGAKWFGKAATAAFYVSVSAVIFCRVVLKYEGMWVIWALVGATAILMLNALVRYFLMFRQICKNTYDFGQEVPASVPKT